MSGHADVHPCDEPPTIADAARAGLPEGETSHSPSGASFRGRRILKRIALTVVALVVGLAALAAVAYNFGSMERPTPEIRAQYDALVASGQAVPVRSAGLRVPIPGCRCHSSDPVMQVQHSGYAIRECKGCHDRSSAAQAAATSGY